MFTLGNAFYITFLCLLNIGTNQGVDAAKRVACAEGQRVGIGKNVP